MLKFKKKNCCFNMMICYKFLNFFSWIHWELVRDHLGAETWNNPEISSRWFIGSGLKNTWLLVPKSIYFHFILYSNFLKFLPINLNLASSCVKLVLNLKIDLSQSRLISSISIFYSTFFFYFCFLVFFFKTKKSWQIKKSKEKKNREEK